MSTRTGTAAPGAALGSEKGMPQGAPDDADRQRALRRIAEFDATIAVWRARAAAAQQAVADWEQARRRYLAQLTRNPH